MFISILISLLAPIYPVAALVNCPNSQSIEHQANQILNVAIIDEESRSTFAEYARQNKISLRELYRKYSATGFIECEGKQVIAHLVGNQRTVVSVSHPFYEDDCKLKKFSSCDFYTFETEEKLKRHRIKAWASGGCAGDRTGNFSNDWTVFELADPVDMKVSPYVIPEKPAQPTEDLPVVQVSAFSRSFKVNEEHPRHLTNCSYKQINRGSKLGHFTDCDASKGSSGSAHIIDTAKGPTLLGLTVASTPDHMNYRPYNPTNNATVSLPIEGKFHATIQSVIQKTGGPSR